MGKYKLYGLVVPMNNKIRFISACVSQEVTFT